MTQLNNDQHTPAVTEAEQLQQLRALTIKRMLEMAADPDIKASGLSVIAKFLSEAGVLARLPVTPIQAGKLPFGADDRPTRMPFPADTDEPRSFKPLDNTPFITA